MTVRIRVRERASNPCQPSAVQGAARSSPTRWSAGGPDGSFTDVDVWLEELACGASACLRKAGHSKTA
eukprot:scaffold76810_cov39-Prasinocladus_malaysianus.AAC.1